MVLPGEVENRGKSRRESTRSFYWRSWPLRWVPLRDGLSQALPALPVKLGLGSNGFSSRQFLEEEMR